MSVIFFRCQKFQIDITLNAVWRPRLLSYSFPLSEDIQQRHKNYGFDEVDRNVQKDLQVNSVSRN